MARSVLLGSSTPVARLAFPAFVSVVAALAVIWTAADVRPGNAAEAGITSQSNFNVVNAEVFDQKDEDKKKKKKKRKSRPRGGSFN